MLVSFTLVATEAQFKLYSKKGKSLGWRGNMVEFRVLKDVVCLSVCLSPSLGWPHSLKNGLPSQGPCLLLDFTCEYWVSKVLFCLGPS